MTSDNEGNLDRGLCAVCGEKAFYNFYGCLACDSCRWVSLTFCSFVLIINFSLDIISFQQKKRLQRNLFAEHSFEGMFYRRRWVNNDCSQVSMNSAPSPKLPALVSSCSCILICLLSASKIDISQVHEKRDREDMTWDKNRIKINSDWKRLLRMYTVCERLASVSRSSTGVGKKNWKRLIPGSSRFHVSKASETEYHNDALQEHECSRKRVLVCNLVWEINSFIEFLLISLKSIREQRNKRVLLCDTSTISNETWYWQKRKKGLKGHTRSSQSVPSQLQK